MVAVDADPPLPQTTIFFSFIWHSIQIFAASFIDGLNISSKLKFNYADDVRGEIDIDNYAESAVQLRYWFHSDSDTPQGEGLFLDDITVNVDGENIYFESLIF